MTATLSCEQLAPVPSETTTPEDAIEAAAAAAAASQTNKTRGYLIALIQEEAQIRAFGSPADRNEFDEILEINGRQLGRPEELDHAELVRHIQECIKLKNISLRVRRRPQQQHQQQQASGPTDDGDDCGEPKVSSSSSSKAKLRNCYLLDVFVIGTDARAQLSRFFELASSRRLGSPQIDQLDLAKLTHCIERLDGGGGRHRGDHALPPAVAAAKTCDASRRRARRRARTGGGQELGARGRHSIDGQQKGTPMEEAADSANNNDEDDPHPQQQQQQQSTCDCCALTGTGKLLPANFKVFKHQRGARVLAPSGGRRHSGHPREPISPICARLSGRFTSSTPIGRLLSDAELLKLVRLYDKITQICGQQQQQPDLIDLSLAGGAPATQTSGDAGQQQQQRQHQQEALGAQDFQSNCQSIPGVGGRRSIRLSDLIHLVVAQANSELERAQNWSLKQQQQHPSQQHPEPSELTCDLFVQLTSILCKHQFEAACHAYDLVAAQLLASGPRARARQRPRRATNQTEPTRVRVSGERVAAADSELHQVGSGQAGPIGAQAETAATAATANQFVNHQGGPDTQSDQIRGASATIKWVRVEKNSGQALGATIKNDPSGRVLIGRIIFGGLAHSSGLLVEGDEILEVNGLELSGKNINEVIDLLDQLEEDQLTFKISSSGSGVCGHGQHQHQQGSNKRLLVRTLFKFEGGANHHREEPGTGANNKTTGAADLLVAPCRELALSFEAGEILEIIEHQRDPSWWQARRVASPLACDLSALAASASSSSDLNDRDQRQQLIMSSVGLIPSASLLAEAKGSGHGVPSSSSSSSAATVNENDHERGRHHYLGDAKSSRQHQSLLAELKTINLEQATIIRASERLVAKWFACPRGAAAWASRRSKKRLAMAEQTGDAAAAESPGDGGGGAMPQQMEFYEQVVEVSRGRGPSILSNPSLTPASAPMSTSSIRRPIFLVGPKMIGQDELLGLLLKNSRFSTAISHTTRQPRGQEVNGVDFYFVDQPKFEANIQADGFVEYGQYHGQYYGISVEAIQRVIDSNRICVQLVNSASIPVSRVASWGPKLKPIFIFVKPDLEQPDTLYEYVRNLMNNSSNNPSLARQKLSRRRRIIGRTNLNDCLRLIHEEVATIESNYLPYFDSIVTIGSLRSAYDHLLRLIDNMEHDTFRWIPISWLEAASADPPTNSR